MDKVRQKADVVFVIDTSGSMGPCIRDVCKNIRSLVDGFRAEINEPWDIRLDFVGANSWNFQSVYHRGSRDALLRALYSGEGRFFTSDIDEFKNALDHVEGSIGYDELTLVGIDTALDFPWRPQSEVRRGVVVLTDEEVDTGAAPEFERARVDDGSLLEKIVGLGVQLFIMAPPCPVYETLGSVHAAHRWVVEHEGLASVSFDKLLHEIGKTISVTRLQRVDRPVPRALYGQDNPSSLPGW